MQSLLVRVNEREVSKIVRVETNSTWSGQNRQLDLVGKGLFQALKKLKYAAEITMKGSKIFRKCFPCTQHFQDRASAG